MTTKVTDDVILSNAFLITLLVKEISLQISNFGFYYVLYSIKKALYIERIIYRNALYYYIKLDIRLDKILQACIPYFLQFEKKKILTSKKYSLYSQSSFNKNKAANLIRL